jgi:DNA-directed RNA polymerase subunit RPC12/RpoP
MNKKNCFYCQSKIVSKDGFDKGVQRYKCASCGKRFKGGHRLNSALLWKEYTKGKQTYSQLAVKYDCSAKTIQRKIDTVKTKRETVFPSAANVLMDTTYFGRKFGVMVFKDSLSGRFLYKQYVKQETAKLYLTGIEEAEEG